MKNAFNIISKARTYHMVWFECEKSNSVSSIAELSKFDFERRKIFKYKDYELFHGVIRSEKRYFGSETHAVIDEKRIAGNDNIKIYGYDIFLIKTTANFLMFDKSSDSSLNQNIKLLIVAMPLKSLCKDYVDLLWSKKSNLGIKGFLGTKVNTIISQNHNRDVRNFGELKTHINGLKIIIADDTNVAAIVLSGRLPLKSDLYISQFQDKVSNNSYNVDLCSLHGSVNHMDDDISQEFPKSVDNNEVLLDITKSQTSIHMDNKGHFQLYVHSTGHNFFTIPKLIEFMSTLEANDTIKDEEVLLGSVRRFIRNPLSIRKRDNAKKAS